MESLKNLDQQNFEKLHKITGKSNSCDKLCLALDKISLILNSSLKIEDVFELALDELKLLIDYDKALIMFLDGDNLSIKSSRNIFNISDKNAKISLPNGFHFINNFSKSSKSLIKQLDINEPHSLIHSPLSIKETLFGVIILIKEEKNFFEFQDEKILGAFASCISYSAKDAELSNVFKMQLKILNDNVVDRANALELIKEQNAKILQADKMKTEFLANISHELRTPLNAIIGFSEALKLKIFGTLNKKQEEYICDIHTSGIHLLGMINDLLDLTKIEAKEMKLSKKIFDVTIAVKEVLNIVKALADKKKIDLKSTFSDDNIEVLADYQNFQQILYNLLSNAIKFTPDKGQINVKVEQVNDNLQVSVKDNGIGIDKKFHEKIFDKFQQVDSSYTRKQGSTGLGLTITKKLIEMHGGSIWLESEINKGSTFIFTIPVNKE